jgi:hypothetical protein
MIKTLIKKLRIPASNTTKEIDAIQLWYVRWTSRDGPYSSSTREETECFPCEQDAKDFRDALENAFRLTRILNHGAVTLSKE